MESRNSIKIILLTTIFTYANIGYSAQLNKDDLNKIVEAFNQSESIKYNFHNVADNGKITKALTFRNANVIDCVYNKNTKDKVIDTALAIYNSVGENLGVTASAIYSSVGQNLGTTASLTYTTASQILSSVGPNLGTTASLTYNTVSATYNIINNLFGSGSPNLYTWIANVGMETYSSSGSYNDNKDHYIVVSSANPITLEGNNNTTKDIVFNKVRAIFGVSGTYDSTHQIEVSDIYNQSNLPLQTGSGGSGGTLSAGGTFSSGWFIYNSTT